MSKKQDNTTLVLGGTGKTGRRVVERLRARELPVRIGSRSAEPSFDWEDRSSWAPALEGASAAFVSYYPDLAVPGAPEAVGAFAEQAAAAGMRRLVLLSGRGEEEAQRAEQVVEAAGTEWTVVRCSWFNQNFSEDYLLEPILAGEIALPAADVPEPFVDADDIADVAVAALTDDGHQNRVYELTGPRLLSFTEAIGESAGPDVPEEIVGLLGYLFSEVLDGRNSKLGDGVQQALGREPRDFSDYVRETAATGVWNV